MRIPTKTKVLDFLFPRICIKCGRPKKYICEQCKNKYLTPYYVQQCHVCGVEVRKGLVHRDCLEYTNLEGVLIPFVYSNLIKLAISSIKYKSEQSIMLEVGPLTVNSVSSKLLALPNLSISYVPTSIKRKRERGFDQAEVLCKIVGKWANTSISSLLRRSEGAESQVGKGAEDRKTGIKGQYSLLGGKVPSNILLVDDIMTTGSTLETCAGLLREGGAARIWGLVIARNPDFAIVNQV